MTEERKPTKRFRRRGDPECERCGDTGLTHHHVAFGVRTPDGIPTEAVYEPCPNGCQRPEEATR